MERLYKQLKEYVPYNQNEEADKEAMLEFMEKNPDALSRENKTAHFATSAWVVNKDRTKVLMIYHNIYNSWAWVGGHADGIEDLREVAMRELEEETGVKNARFATDHIWSLETLTVDGHMKRGSYVSSHLHFNITYLVEADEEDVLRIQEDENSGVQWWNVEEVFQVCSEPWMIENVYKKLVR